MRSTVGKWLLHGESGDAVPSLITGRTSGRSTRWPHLEIWATSTAWPPVTWPWSIKPLPKNCPGTEKMAALLDNLANASIQKNNTIDKLVEKNQQLAKIITNLTAAIAKLKDGSPPTGQWPGQERPPHWSPTKPRGDTMGYWWTYGWKVNLGYSNASCSYSKEEYCRDVTCTNTKGGSNLDQGWPKPPTWHGTPEDSTKSRVAYSHLSNYIRLETGCANPYNLDLTALIDTSATFTLLTSKAPASPNTHTQWKYFFRTSCWCVHSPLSFLTLQQPPIHCSPMWHGMQSVLSQHRLQNLPQRENYPPRVEGPQESTVASQNNQWWLDHQPQNQGQLHHLWNSRWPRSGRS